MTGQKKKIRIQYFRSTIWFKRVKPRPFTTSLNQIVEREDTPSVRGMIAKIPHLVQVVE